MKKNKKTTGKRLLAVFLSAAMCLGMFCTTAFASTLENGESSSPASVTSGETKAETPTTPDKPDAGSTTQTTPDMQGTEPTAPTTPGTQGTESTAPTTPDTQGTESTTPTTPGTQGTEPTAPTTPGTQGTEPTTPTTPGTQGTEPTTPTTPDTQEEETTTSTPQNPTQLPGLGSILDNVSDLISGDKDEDEDTNKDADEEESEMVTLTYDINAGEDVVTGISGPLTYRVKKGESVLIKDTRGVKRDGYTFYGWSTNPNADTPDLQFSSCSRYSPNEDITLYGVWFKEPPQPPEGAEVKTVFFTSKFYIQQEDNKYAELTAATSPSKPANYSYDYSYQYGGQTYSGTTSSTAGTYRTMDVLVAEDGTPTVVTLTLKGYQVEGYTLFQSQSNYTSAGWENVSKNTVTTVSITASSSNLYNYNYYAAAASEPDVPEEPGETEEPDATVTERNVDIEVSFQNDPMNPFTLDVLNGHYILTYSYKDANGEIVTKTLDSKDATPKARPRQIIEEIDGEFVVTGTDDSVKHHYYQWNIKVPVFGDGIYLTINQSGFEIDGYIWDGVYGTTDKDDSSDGSSLGMLYVSKNNNPVTPYIYNVYAKKCTVTYTNGVDGTVLQSYTVKEGAATPNADTPSRSGYTFTGWSPEVADTVTQDVTYVAQWREVSSGGRPTPRPDPTPDPKPPVVDVPEEDPPLVDVPEENPPVDIPEEDPPLVDIPEVDPPLVDVPEEEPPLVDVPETDVPLAPKPTKPSVPAKPVISSTASGVDILDEEVPLAEVPKTSDSTALWLAIALAAAASLTGVKLSEKKKAR